MNDKELFDEVISFKIIDELKFASFSDFSNLYLF
jgi:hypothetical protein